MLHPSYTITTIDALNSVSPLTKQQGEEILDSVISSNWFIQRHGRLSLGLRSLIELESYLEGAYEGKLKLNF